MTKTHRKVGIFVRFGLDVPTTGAFADARKLAELAAEAEAAGWDGFFVWDVLLSETNVVDPWIALTAIALRTTRMQIGVLVAPLARHRPWLVARRLANLDHLSQGRNDCAVGIGYQERDFTAFSESGEPIIRAKRLDESLTILDRLWREDQVSFSGEYFTLNDVTLLPKPIQSPRIPIWVSGGWPNRAPFRRAARWDGACLQSHHRERREPLSLADFREIYDYVKSQRSQQLAGAPFEFIMSGETSLDQQQGIEQVRPFAEAGATWWVEEGLGFSFEEFRQRILAGPPRW